MAFGRIQSSRTHPVAEINMIPFIDIMLVLLVVFIITAPLVTQSVVLDLPSASALPPAAEPSQPLSIAVDQQGVIFINQLAVEREQLLQQLHQAAQQTPTPVVHLSADKSVDYGVVAALLTDLSQAGLHKVGFVSKAEENL